MKSGPIIDPELRALLHEISSDPRSQLMKLVTQGLDARVLLHEPPISEGEPFFTRAERHLVAEYRHEVGRWLFEGAKLLYLSAPRSLSGAFRGSFAGWGEIRSLVKLGQDRDRLLRQRLLDDESRAALEPSMPAAALGNDARALAVASLRLVPRDSARNLIALASFLLGKRSEGFSELAEIVEHRPTDWYRSVAWQNIAFGHLEDGDLAASHAHYLEAHRAGEPRPEPLVGLVTTCLLEGDRGKARRFAGLLSELPREGTTACIGEHREWLAGKSAAGGLALDARRAGEIREISDELPEVGRQIAFALLGQEEES